MRHTLKASRSAVIRVAMMVTLSSALASSANADFNFNPSGVVGGPTFSISGLGFGAGNALAVGSIPLSVGSNFTVLFETHLTSLTGPNAPAAVPGLNTAFQITEVAVLSETVTSLVTTSAGTTAQFALNTSGPNLVNIYQNNAVVFNDAAGTGFAVGTVIMSLKGTSFTSSSFTDATEGGGKPTVKFNQTGAGNAPNATADQGTGSTGVNFSVTPGYNTAFFQPPAGTPLLTTSLENLNLSSFFDAISPSTLIDNLNTNLMVAPNIGTNNGTTGTDFQLQVSGFTQSFAVPEPASVAMTLIGFVGVGLGSVVARRRRAVA